MGIVHQKHNKTSSPKCILRSERSVTSSSSILNPIDLNICRSEEQYSGLWTLGGRMEEISDAVTIATNADA